MKIAQTVDGIKIEAAKDSPAKAVCTYCGGAVVLRGRKIMGSKEKSYFWRHLDNQNQDCPGRVRSRR